MRRLPVVITSFVVATAATAGCSNTGIPDPAPAATKAPTSAPAPGDAKTIDGAKATAKLAGDRLGSGDWAGTWDLFSAATQKGIPRADYIKVRTACPGVLGIALTVADARMEGDAVVVRYERVGGTFSYTYVYEAGHWRLVMPDKTIAEYAGGSDKAIATRKADGSC